MNNNINYPETTIPANYSGVTINITSPTVNANTGRCTCTQPIYTDSRTIQDSNAYSYQPAAITNDGTTQPTSQVSNKTPQTYPPQYYMNNYNYASPTSDADKVQNAQQTQDSENIKASNDYSSSENTSADNNATSQEIINNLNQMAEEKRNQEKNEKDKKVVALTNEYIMSLENYLNNPNSEIRLLAAEEILTRFNEDRNRYDDLALNALVNKMLQDPEKIIRTAAMSALSSGLASGNDYTIKLLEEIQKKPDSDKNDVIEAANILLKKSTETQTVKEVDVQAPKEDTK